MTVDAISLLNVGALVSVVMVAALMAYRRVSSDVSRKIKAEQELLGSLRDQRISLLESENRRLRDEIAELRAQIKRVEHELSVEREVTGRLMEGMTNHADPGHPA
jgi:septal ring factor EnvC (AmiA/AmiB activator)